MGRDLPRKQQKGNRPGKAASRIKFSAGSKAGAKRRARRKVNRNIRTHRAAKKMKQPRKKVGHYDSMRKSTNTVLSLPAEQKSLPSLDEHSDLSPLHPHYREAIYLGGEALVEKWMPDGMLLPDITCEDLIQAGLDQYKSQMIRLAGTSEMRDVMWTATMEGRPFSLVRLGDGELLSLAYDTVLSPAEVHELGAFLPYAGVPVPDASVQNALVYAIQHADYIGVPVSRKPAFQTLMFRIFQYYNLPIRALKLTTSTINYNLYYSGYLLSLLQGKRVLLVGNKASSASQVLRERGIQISGTVFPVSGFQDIDRVLMSCSQFEYDIALVAAGVSAVVICQRIASESAKVAIDIGHVADEIAKSAAAMD